MIANLPAILKHLSKESKVADQGSLFGAPELEDMKIVQLPDWDEATKLYYERKALGTFLTGHPILFVKEKYQRRVTHTCSEESSMLQCDRNTRIVVAAMVSKVETSRSGRVNSVYLEDQTGRFIAIAFSDDMERYASCLMPNALVAVQLRPRHDGDRSSMQLIKASRLGHFRTPT